MQTDLIGQRVLVPGKSGGFEEAMIRAVYVRNNEVYATVQGLEYHDIYEAPLYKLQLFITVYYPENWATPQPA